MAIYAEGGTYNAILGVVTNTPSLVAVLTTTPKYVAVVGNVYVAGGGSGGSGTVTTVQFAAPANNAFAVGTPTTTANIAFQNVGITPATVFLRGDGTWATPAGGGGGGGSFTSTSIWTGGTSNKNAYTSPGVVNTVGITINLVASSGSGGITQATLALNGVALAGTFDSTGSWPNLVFSIPAATLTGNTAEIAPSVTVSLTGTFGGSGVNVANAGTLTNTQPILFTTTLSGSYNITSTPFYTTTGALNYSYSNSNAITLFGGVFTPGGNATNPSSSFANIALTGSTISGSASGNGLNGAGIGAVTLSGSVAAVPIYTPAFYTQTANATVPTFGTASTQTTGAAAGSIITYSLPATSASYNWVCTQRPLANLKLRTSLGDTALVPDVTAPTQTISGQVFAVYGYTKLSTINASILVIS